VGDDERVVAFEPIGESAAGAVLDGNSVPPEAGPDEDGADGPPLSEAPAPTEPSDDGEPEGE
jgi:hypothetical protein